MAAMTAIVSKTDPRFIAFDESCKAAQIDPGTALYHAFETAMTAAWAAEDAAKSVAASVAQRLVFFALGAATALVFVLVGFGMGIVTVTGGVSPEQLSSISSAEFGRTDLSGVVIQTR